MKVLFDHNTPKRLRQYLPEHSVDTAWERGWAEVSNGDLLTQAERDGYDVLITADQSMSYQQDIARRQVGVVVLLSNRWLDVQPRIEDIRIAESELAASDSLLAQCPNAIDVWLLRVGYRAVASIGGGSPRRAG